jgi:hypothetical protein
MSSRIGLAVRILRRFLVWRLGIRLAVRVVVPLPAGRVRTWDDGDLVSHLSPPRRQLQAINPRIVPDGVHPDNPSQLKAPIAVVA